MIKTGNDKLNIGSKSFGTRVLLAPMAGYTNLPFRIMCERGGAKLTYTEMINSKALFYKDKKTDSMLDTNGQKEAVAVQIFGSDAYFMSEAVKYICSLGRFSIIDINMGCPAPKIVKNADGCALMKDVFLASRIVETAKKESALPVTVKMRKGIDENHVNVLEFAKAMEESGADAVTVHGRTAKQYYCGEADLEIIRQVKQSLSIPVIANGDAFTPEKIKYTLDYTLCDAVMVGRGAQANPFIFSQADDYLQKGTYKKLTDRQKILNAVEHYRMSIEYIGQELAVRQMRKQLFCYLKSVKNSTVIKNAISRELSYEKVIRILSEFADSL